ncbi:hypothetical protein [Ferrovibrio sp.]|uniref:hypothetical protein n=1 Tax=Ferrovibrio sp. TaxID=1917215 RepID=UPI00311D6731
MIKNEDFCQLFEAWSPAWRFCQETVVGFRQSHGAHWLCFHRRIYTRNTLPQPTIQLSTHSIVALRRSISLTEKDHWCTPSNVLSNPYYTKVGDLVLNLVAPNAHAHEFFEPLASPAREGPLRLPTLTISAPTPDQFYFPNERILQTELRSNSEPYTDIDDLLLELQVEKHGLFQRNNGISEIILTPPAEISRASKIEKNRIYIEINASLVVDPSKISVGMKVFPAPQAAIQRLTIRGEKFNWRAQDESNEGTYQIDHNDLNVPKGFDIGFSQLFLNLDNRYLGYLLLADESASLNEKLSIQRAFDPNDSFRQTFFDKPNEFEQRVAVLTSLLGLSPLLYGGMAALTDAPDLMALSPQRHLYVIECTTGDINSKGKLQRLYDRTKKIENGLRNSSYQPVAIVPLIVTSLPRSETSPHWKTAQALKIGLLCREDIENLLRQIPVPPSTDNLFTLARESVPKGEQ